MTSPIPRNRSGALAASSTIPAAPAPCSELTAAAAPTLRTELLIPRATSTLRAGHALLAALVLAVSFGGCASRAAIVNHWVHSHEEDSAGVQVYRPSTYAFGPAFGRDGFDLRGDGSAIVYSVGPADEPIATPGRWILSDDMLTITAEASRPQRFDVTHVDSSLLRLRVMR